MPTCPSPSSAGARASCSRPSASAPASSTCRASSPAGSSSAWQSRALANGPSLLLADEPTGNLDTESSTEIMELFLRLRRERRLTIVVVTHEPHIADYTERIVTFRDGRIVSDVPQAPSRRAPEAARE